MICPLSIERVRVRCPLSIEREREMPSFEEVGIYCSTHVCRYVVKLIQLITREPTDLNPGREVGHDRETTSNDIQVKSHDDL